MQSSDTLWQGKVGDEFSSKCGSKCRHRLNQESRAVARKPRDAACFCLYIPNDSSIIIYIILHSLHKSRCECESINAACYLPYPHWPGISGWPPWSRSSMFGFRESEPLSAVKLFSKCSNLWQRYLNWRTDGRLSVAITHRSIARWKRQHISALIGRLDTYNSQALSLQCNILVHNHAALTFAIDGAIAQAFSTL